MLIKKQAVSYNKKHDRLLSWDTACYKLLFAGIFHFH